MKHTLLCIVLFATSFSASAQRFLTEVFPGYSKTANIAYGNNYQVLTGTPTLVSLEMDIYEPAGIVDTMAKRPLIIFMHEGSFLPGICVNQQPVGTRDDSVIVEICRRFAKRGYVVANMDYRMGWNPAGSNVDIRKGTLIQAAYRGVQDAKACVRFFRKEAGLTNAYKIDTTRIILGGSGSGATIAVNYGCLNNPAQIIIPKYISSATEPPYGFVAGQPYINQAVLGDFDGYGGMAGVNDPTNSPGHSNTVQFVFSMGAILGDSSWMTVGCPPMVSFQTVGDPGTPYGTGIVYVPGTPPQAVVEVSGGGVFLPTANAVGNNNCFKNAGFTDVYTVRANAVNGGVDGLFPIVTDPVGQSGPWDWWDSSSVVAYAGGCGISVGAADTMMMYAGFSNPTMSKTKSNLYLDSMMGYLNPRIVYCLNLSGTPINSVEGIVNDEQAITIFPNPSAGNFEINSLRQPIRSVVIKDITGRVVRQIDEVNGKAVEIKENTIPKGVYFVTVNTDAGRVIKKIIVE
jgi:hypothetical protein